MDEHKTVREADKAGPPLAPERCDDCSDIGVIMNRRSKRLDLKHRAASPNDG
jgi:hypothetical protein